ncbi:aminopeptidase N [soil metagenome]
MEITAPEQIAVKQDYVAQTPQRGVTLPAVMPARAQAAHSAEHPNLSQTSTLTSHAPARDVLTQAEATERAERVSDVVYDVVLDLVSGQPTYRGTLNLSFKARGDQPLFLDFRGRTIERLEVNGTPVEPDFTGFRLTLPGGLITDEMTVSADYVNHYDTTGDGFHRFVDPEDGEEYVYTNFEPYEAHRLFPCFDQPDIKARYTFTVTAPESWQVIANSPLTESHPAPDGRTTHEFQQTELFSTYLVALVGGPYVARRIEHKGLKLGLFARRSMERYLDEHAQEIFEVTTQGLDFYDEMFERAYPFAKYDQLFVPEYNSGAMENVGCVTYNESYLFRDPSTENQRLDRAETFLHELAHMWFGNLVTMRWWDDLWLNESFATYISYLALTEATRYRQAWKVFNYDIKRWAYHADQLPTTHPIAGAADDTEIAFLNFDGITYGKGASVLKQLVKYVGRDAFRDGMRLYFRRHEWSNATLSDFLACLEISSGASLAEWARVWLRTASVNTLAATWQVSDGAIEAMAIEQSAPPEHDTLRPHALEVALGHEEDGRLEVESWPAWIEGQRTELPEAAGRAAPDLVFPNHGDHAFAKIALDPTSLEFVRHRLDRVEDPLLRELLWMSLWEMVRDRQLRSTEYLDIGRARLGAEPDLDILDMALERAGLVIGRFVPEAQREAEAHAWFETALANLASAEAGDRRILWARSSISVAASTADVERLVRVTDAREDVGGFEFDQEMRWAVAVKAVAFGLAGAEDWLAFEAARDRSDRGRRAMLKAEAARPTAEAKSETWERIHGPGYGSFHLTRAAMQGFFWPQQADLLEPYVDRFFDKVRDIFATRDHPFARWYLLSLFPAYRADPQVLDRSRRMLSSLDGSLPTLSRQLAEAADDLDRQIKVRAFAAEG